MKYKFLRSNDYVYAHSGLRVKGDVPVFRIIYVQQGQGTYYLEDKTLPVKEGDIFIAAPGYRRIDFPTQHTVRLKIVSFTTPPRWMNKAYERFHGPLRQRQLLVAIIDDLIFGLVRRRDNLLQVAIDLFIEQGELALAHNRDIYETAEQIRSQPQLKYNLAELARRCNCSMSHFRALFIKETSMSPKAFITKCKMELALILLQEEHMQVKLVATTVGYNNSHDFSKQFKQFFGKSPLAITRRKPN